MYTWKCGCIVIHHHKREELRTMEDDNEQEQIEQHQSDMRQPKNKLKWRDE